MAGDLTIRDVTKPITLDVILIGPVEHPRTKKKLVGIKATGTINRKDFNVGSKLPEFVVANEVMFQAKGEFNKD